MDYNKKSNELTFEWGELHDKYHDFETYLLESMVNNMDKDLAAKVRDACTDNKHCVTMQVNGVSVNALAIFQLMYDQFERCVRKEANKMVEEVTSEKINALNDVIDKLTEIAKEESKIFLEDNE